MSNTEVASHSQATIAQSLPCLRYHMVEAELDIIPIHGAVSGPAHPLCELWMIESNRFPDGKSPAGHGAKGWTTALRASAHEASKWDVARFPTTGLRLGHDNRCALDVDSDDKRLSDAIFALIAAQCPHRFAFRVGRENRFIIPLVNASLSAGSSKIHIKLKGHDKTELIELLGRGRQYVIHGIHPKTCKPYQWYGRFENRARQALPDEQIASAIVSGSIQIPDGFDFVEWLVSEIAKLEFVERVETSRRMSDRWRSEVASDIDLAAVFSNLSDARRKELKTWGERELELLIGRLWGLTQGRGTETYKVAIRVGILVKAGLIDGEAVAQRIYDATGDQKTAWRDWLHGVELSNGSALEVRRELSGPLLLAQAAGMGLPIGGFPAAIDAAGEVRALSSLPTATGIAKVLLSAALKDRAAELGAKRKSKTVTDARANFSRLCVALAERDFVSSGEAFELGVQSNDLDIGSLSDGKNPRLPTPDTRRLAELVLSTAASGGNIVLAIKGGAEVLNPPSLDGGIPDITGGCYPADDSFFDVLSSRLVGVNRGGTIFFAHKTLEGDVERIPIDVLRDLFSNIFVVEEESKTLAVDWYRRHPRFALKRAIFDPNKPEVTAKEFNYWRGFGVERRLGRALIRRFVRHIREIVCKRDRRKFKYLIRWLAWAVQNPAKNPETVVVLKSAEEGSGKSTVSDVMRKLFGKHPLCQ